MSGRRSDRPRRWLRGITIVLGAVALSVVVVRVFVGDVFPVSSASMRPTIWAGPTGPGEPAETAWVWVTYDRSTPRRYELLVLRAEDDGEPLVKRALGLPGERVRLSRGDLFVDGALLGYESWRLVPLWSSRHQPWESWLQLRSSDGLGWRPDEGALEVRASESGSVAGSAHLELHKPARDGCLAPDGTREPGAAEVNDLAVDLEFSHPAEAEGAVLAVTLTEAGDAFTCVLDLRDGAWTARLWRTALGAPLPPFEDEAAAAAELLAQGPATSPAGSGGALRFANVDDELVVSTGGAVVLTHRYERNRPHERPGVAKEHPGARLVVRSDRVGLRLSSLVVQRDLTWFPEGEFAVHEELILGPEEVFVLGDNARVSTDSRRFGPVDLRRIRGRVTRAVWPAEARRRPLLGVD